MTLWIPRDLSRYCQSFRSKVGMQQPDARRRFSPSSLRVVSMGILALLLGYSVEARAGERRECWAPGIVIGGVAPRDATSEGWDGIRRLAYEARLRAETDGLQYEVDLDAATRELGAAWRSLNESYPGAWSTFQYNYECMVLQVKFTAEVQRAFDMVAPPFPLISVGQKAAAIPFSQEFRAFCEEACCWIARLEGVEPETRIYFPANVNIVYALRRLRDFPDVEGVALIPHERESAQSPRKALAGSCSGGTCYLTVVNSGAQPSQEYYIADRREARRIKEAEAKLLPGFTPVPLPSDVPTEISLSRETPSPAAREMAPRQTPNTAIEHKEVAPSDVLPNARMD